jgi:hypothetical protein
LVEAKKITEGVHIHPHSPVGFSKSRKKGEKSWQSSHSIDKETSLTLGQCSIEKIPSLIHIPPPTDSREEDIIYERRYKNKRLVEEENTGKEVDNVEECMDRMHLYPQESHDDIAKSHGFNRPLRQQRIKTNDKRPPQQQLIKTQRSIENCCGGSFTSKGFR